MTRSPRPALLAGMAALALAVPVGTVAASVAPAAASASAPAAHPGDRADRCARPGLDRAPRRPGSAEYNRWLGESFTRVLLNTRDQAERVRILDRIVAEDYIQHNPLVAEGRQGLVDFLPVIYQAFPDACFVLRDVFATEDRVVTRWTWTGTLTGAPFLGVEPAGQEVEFDAIDIWTERNGQLHEHWDQFDWTRAMVQLNDGEIVDPLLQVAEQPVDR